MTVTKCDCCGREVTRGDTVRLYMGRPDVYDSYGRLAVPSTYEFCDECGHLIEEKFIELREKRKEEK